MSIFDNIRETLLGEQKRGEEMATVNDQPREDIDLVGFVKNKVEDVRSQANRITHEGIWMTNIAYLLGFDSVYYDPTQRQFRPVGKGGVSRNRIHSNLLLAGAQNRLARMVKNPPKYDVVPNSMETDDKEAAELGLECIGMVWNKQAINKKRIDLGMWKQQCGHAYVGVHYDDSLGEPMIDPTTDEIVGFEGEVRIDVISAFEMFADPLAKTLEDASWIARAKVRKLEYFREHYPERGNLVKEEGAWLLSAQYEMRINTLNSVGPASSGTQEQMKNAAIEISYYEKRSKKHPRGRHVVTANGVLLKNDKLPYGGEIPFAKFDDVVIGGKYYSESLLTHARPLQDQYNTALKKRNAWVTRLLNGKYIAAKGHGLAQEALNDQSGEVVEYTPVPGAKEPSAMDIPSIPQYAYKETDDLKTQLFEIMGLSEVSRGNIPAAGIPAAGMQILLEQDETRLGVETEQDEHSWARVGMLILKCIEQTYTQERTLKTKGKNLDYKIKKFVGKMLKGNNDVTVIRGSTIPNVKALKRQEILNAYTQGLLGDPADPTVREKVLGMMEYGDIGEVWKDYHVDMTQIQKTIEQIEMEEVPEVHKLDNHAMHVLIKNRYRKGDKWENLNAMQRTILDADIEAHTQAAITLMNPALAQPPDDGPPPEAALEMLRQQGAAMGIENPGAPPDNIQTGAM